MLRDEILALMEALRLRGMQAVYDEVLSNGRKQKAIPEKVILEVLPGVDHHGDPAFETDGNIQRILSYLDQCLLRK